MCYLAQYVLNVFLFYFCDQALLQDKQSCRINMVTCCNKGRNYIHSFFLMKSYANLRSVSLSMTKYLLHGMMYNIAELLHSSGLMHSTSPRALIHTHTTILQCRTPYHGISIYYSAAVSLADRE